MDNMTINAFISTINHHKAQGNSVEQCVSAIFSNKVDQERCLALFESAGIITSRKIGGGFLRSTKYEYSWK